MGNCTLFDRPGRGDKKPSALVNNYSTLLLEGLIQNIPSLMDLQAVNAIYILIWQSECALTFKMPGYHKNDAGSHLKVAFYAFRVFQVAVGVTLAKNNVHSLALSTISGKL